MLALVADDGDLAVWWGTTIECASAIARRAREVGANDSIVSEVWHRLDSLATVWTEVEPSPGVRRLAIRLLRVHPLRSADALQLAAALVFAEDRPELLTMVSLDDRLVSAAWREGLNVLP